MSRAMITLNGKLDRYTAIGWIEKSPPGTRVEFKAAQRTGAQNDRMWAMLTDVATQVHWHGILLKADDWKLIFLDALKRELRTVPNIDGTGIVVLGKSSSDLSKSEMSDLIELIHAFGARHGVTFHDSNSNSSQSASSPDVTEADTPASDSLAPNLADAGNQYDSSEGSLGPDDGVQADAKLDKPGIDLPAGWQAIYATAMTRVSEKPKSLATRRNEALKHIGGEPSEADRAEMEAIEELVKRRNSGELSPDTFKAALREILPAGVET